MVISVNGSPPHETKMRQISEGVHGIEMKKTDTRDDGRTVASTPFPTTEDPTTEDPTTGGKSTSPEEISTSVADSTVPDHDLPQLGKVASVAEPLDDPPAPPEKPRRASADYLLPFPGTRRGSDSSTEQEKGLKRKLGDRAVSESREAEFVGKKASKKDITDAATTSVAGAKRSRDEEGKDQNPKEAKRPSPPPEETTKTQVEKPPVASSSKMVSPCISGSGKLNSQAFYRSASWHMQASVRSRPLRNLRIPSRQSDREKTLTKMQILARPNVPHHHRTRSQARNRNQPQEMDSWHLPLLNLRLHL